ncbi:MAG: dihydropteroate synthase [Armatimonadota bacterium]|nr:dihydropteroate synthase [Armatimonadota bacterium]
MRTWKCGKFELPLGRKTYVMGIVNVTPDSFSGDGISGQTALEHALHMVEAGADILDIGGESTRPGAQPVTEDEELRRVLPLVEALAPRVSVPLSVDTTKAAVARAALAAGAAIINDISAATFEAQMLEVLAASDGGCILMHLRGTPQTMGWSTRTRKTEGGTRNDDVIAEIKAFWSERVAAAEKAGIAPERIALDAGFGFGKSLEENLEILRRGRELADFGFPTLSGTSRKSTIGKILGDAPVSERLWGTAATVALAIAHGCDIVRVHDVREMAQVARVADAVTRRAWQESSTA